eukprot:TRINITY_DN30977_c0_g1_i1.p2 TRINITY_DN30977_c0_g1~~TRINITY_DN30977_c0_g1_i1.p2  ORF type:complete len:170 (+),score=42.77 TRINITY_DN30977_c0_g1_i1:587-1096(+)
MTWKIAEQEQIDMFKLLHRMQNVMLAVYADVKDSVEAPHDSLYYRIGGLNKISNFVDDFIERIFSDNTLDANDRIHNAKQVVPKQGFKMLCIEYFAQAAGGPQRYHGHGLKAAREMLGITDKEAGKFGVLLVDAMDECDVGETEQRQFLTFLATLRDEILGGSSSSTVI